MKIDVTVVLKSPLHIGALAPAGTAAVRGMVKTQDGWPYIPASTLKGRLRHTVERLARGLGYFVCDTHQDMCKSVQDACPVCLIFGSPWLEGKLYFADLLLSGPPEILQPLKERHGSEWPSTVLRHGVGISRSRKVAADNLLYTTELFQPGIPWVFKGTLCGAITMCNAAWVVAGLRAMQCIGGDSTRGLGWIDIQTQVETEAAKSVSDEELLQALRRPQ